MQKHGLVIMIKQNTIDLIHNTRGFTLLETMMALGVLTIGIIAMMTMQTSAITGNYRASNMTIASSIASRQIEKLRNVPCDSVFFEWENYYTINSTGDPYFMDSSGDTYFVDQLTDDIYSIDQSTGYEVSPTVTPVPGTSGKAQKITVTITNPNDMRPITYSYTKFCD